jgi:hypothetical protein
MWLIRAMWLIWWSTVHRINRITRIHHVVSAGRRVMGRLSTSLLWGDTEVTRDSSTSIVRGTEVTKGMRGARVDG